MPKIQFDVNVDNGVVIDVDNDISQVYLMEVYLIVLSNQTQCYMLQ